MEPASPDLADQLGHLKLAFDLDDEGATPHSGAALECFAAEQASAAASRCLQAAPAGALPRAPLHAQPHTFCPGVEAPYSAPCFARLQFPSWDGLYSSDEPGVFLVKAVPVVSPGERRAGRAVDAVEDHDEVGEEWVQVGGHLLACGGLWMVHCQVVQGTRLWVDAAHHKS